MYGVQITNSSGKVLIRDDESVPMLYNKLTFTAANQTIATSVPSNLPPPMVFTRGQLYVTLVVSGSFWAVKTGSADFTGTAYIYGPPIVSLETAKYGVQIFKANGGLAYSAGRKAIRILDVRNIPDVYKIPLARYSKAIAVAPIAWVQWEPYNATDDRPYPWRFFALTDNTLVAKKQRWLTQSTWPYSPPLYLTIIDVTGL